MKDERSTKKEYVDSVLSAIDGMSIREAFEYIDKIIINYKEQRKELNYEYIRFYFERERYNGSLEIHCERYETEREIRIREEDKQRQKDYKLKQYKQLKKELGL